MNIITVERKELREMWLHVTFRCNLECTHCLFGCSSNYDRFPDMTLNDAKDYALQAVQKGARNIYITGGEPLKWNALEEFIGFLEGINEIDNITLLTNGTLINDKWAGIISDSNKLTVRMSLECYTEETNDSFRGKGSFMRTINGIKKLNSLNFMPWICFTSKSGGTLSEDDRILLEKNFKRVLQDEHGVQIEGLKVLGLYGKGRVEGTKCRICEIETDEDRISRLQCAYGVAAGPTGIVPCPILVDVPDAGMAIESALDASEFTLSYDCCADCFRTGSTCGQ